MNKRVLLGGAAVLIIVAAVAGAQMIPRASDDVPADLVIDPSDNPFAGLDQIFNEEGPDLGLTEEELKAEDDFLLIRIPDDNGDDSDNPLAGETFAGENVEYRTCEKDPGLQSAEYNESGTGEGAALRSIYSFVRLQRVLDLKDCTCEGKVAPISDAIKVRDELKENQGDKWQPFAVSSEFNNKTREIRPQVEAFCMGRF